MATHSNILSWKIPWTEESGGLQSMGSQRVGHDLATEQHVYYTHVQLFAIPWTVTRQAHLSMGFSRQE